MAKTKKKFNTVVLYMGEYEDERFGNLILRSYSDFGSKEEMLKQLAHDLWEVASYSIKNFQRPSCKDCSEFSKIVGYSFCPECGISFKAQSLTEDKFAEWLWELPTRTFGNGTDILDMSKDWDFFVSVKKLKLEKTVELFNAQKALYNYKIKYNQENLKEAK